MPVEMNGINPTQVRFTKKGNAYLNSNAGKAIGVGAMVGHTIHRMTSPEFKKAIKTDYDRIIKNLGKSKTKTAKTAIGVGAAIGVTMNIALGLGLGSIVDACVNKINANKTDKDAEKFKQGFEAGYMMKEFDHDDNELLEALQTQNVQNSQDIQETQDEDFMEDEEEV